MKTLLFILTCLLAFTSTLSGLVMMATPHGSVPNLPILLLGGTTLKSYLVPGLILTIAGGINLAAVYFFLHKNAKEGTRYNWAMAGGGTLSACILTGLLFLPAAHWLHYIFLLIALLVMLMAYQLKGKWAL